MTLRMFLKWCVAKDYLPPAHRLFEATEMAHEDAEPGSPKSKPYTAKELQAMLTAPAASPHPSRKARRASPKYAMLPVIALVALWLFA